MWTSPTYDPATNKIFVSTGTLAGYSQTQSQAIVALDAGTLAYDDSWQLPFGASIADSDWSTTPTLTTDAQGDQLLSVSNKNGILYTFNRNNLAAGPIWQRAIAIGGTCPTCGDGILPSAIFANNVLYAAGGHTTTGSQGSMSALDPGTGTVLWTRPTGSPVLGSPAYVNGMIALVQGSTFEVLDATTGTLLYSYVLPAAVYGGIAVAQGQFYVGAVDGKLYAFGTGPAPTTPPADPNCPVGFTCQDIHAPAAGSESTASGTLTVKAAGTGIRGTGDQFRLLSEPVTGDTQASVTLTGMSPPAGLTAQAGLMVRQSSRGDLAVLRRPGLSQRLAPRRPGVGPLRLRQEPGAAGQGAHDRSGIPDGPALGQPVLDRPVHRRRPLPTGPGLDHPTRPARHHTGRPGRVVGIGLGLRHRLVHRTVGGWVPDHGHGPRRPGRPVPDRMDLRRCGQPHPPR